MRWYLVCFSYDYSHLLRMIPHIDVAICLNRNMKFTDRKLAEHSLVKWKIDREKIHKLSRGHRPIFRSCREILFSLLKHNTKSQTRRIVSLSFLGWILNFSELNSKWWRAQIGKFVKFMPSSCKRTPTGLMKVMSVIQREVGPIMPLEIHPTTELNNCTNILEEGSPWGGRPCLRTGQRWCSQEVK